MSRRTGLPWAPTSLPALRRRWCDVLGGGLDRLREQGSPHSPANTSGCSLR